MMYEDIKKKLIADFHKKHPMLNAEHRMKMLALPLGVLKKKICEYEEWAECSMFGREVSDV